MALAPSRNVDGTKRSDWYLLVYQLPPRPVYLRARVRRLLAQAGAQPLKDSVYALPRSSEALSALQRIAGIAVAGGGDGFVWQGQLVDAPRNEELIGAFRRARDSDYAHLTSQLQGWAREVHRRSGKTPPEARLRLRLAHVRRRFDQVKRLDFFAASGRADAEAALEALEARLRPPALARTREARHPELMGRTWVTRRGVQVDRIGSAWLIRRFIDPDARFRFTDGPSDRARPGELTFDSVGADFTHEDDRCTFETLIKRTGLKNPSLDRMAEIIHDIDTKDGKFGRAEAAGIQQVLSGILRANPDDESRLAGGFNLLDALYQSLAGGAPSIPFESGLRAKRSASPGRERPDEGD
ncbi:MAG: chromate resistance protein [Vicinamibacteria bacterium]|nr:chromate resistance protein [Vicinamibacteria bacterium]